MLVVAIFALREPKGHVSDAAKSASISTTTSPSSPSSSSQHTKPAKSSSSHPKKTTSPPSSSSRTNSGTGPKSVPLVVLNNTTTTGLAREAAQRFEDGGWTVTTYANYSNDILSTCAYYDPDTPGAQDAAEALQQQYPTIKRVQPKFGGLDYGPVVVILTPDYSP